MDGVSHLDTMDAGEYEVPTYLGFDVAEVYAQLF